MRGAIVVAIGLAAGCGGTTAPAGSARTTATTTGGDIVGTTTREAIEAELPAWREAIASTTFERGTAEELATVPPGAEILVVLGTWCGDSRREISRLFRALEHAETLGPLPFSIRYVAVDRSKHAPEVGPELGLVRVPTIVVTRDGAEVGRIVESAPRGVERELVELLAGRSEGVISLRTDLQ